MTAGFAVLSLAGCGTALVDTIQVAPSTQSVVSGQTAQFTATGTVGHGAHPSTTQNVTGQVSWTSSAPAIATISSTGVATGISAGSTTITASMNGYTGTITATATLTVSGSTSVGGNGGGSGAGSSSVTAVAIIPGTQSVAIPGDTSQFLAIGTTGTGATVDLTNQVTWNSSSVQIATIGASSGLATAIGQGTTTITALYASNGSTLTATSTLTVLAGTAEKYSAVTIIPSSQSVSDSGQTGQLIGLATSGTTGYEEDVTSSPQITWSSNLPTVATVSSSGVVTGVSAGTATITAELTNPDSSLVTATATVTVTATASPAQTLLSLTIIPGAITVGNLQDTGNFLAIGTFSTSPTIRDLTNSVTWLSSFPNDFPVSTNGTGVPNPGAPAGVVTAYATGDATIIAEATDPITGSIQTATATFSCPLVEPTVTGGIVTNPGSCNATASAPLLVTLTVYNEGNSTNGWLVTAPSATGTPDVLHCGPGSNAAGFGGSVCVATYPPGTTSVTLTAPAENGVNFGGWSANCTATGAVTAAGPNSCTIPLNNTNDTVGAIFN